jgi:hypothetical protein
MHEFGPLRLEPNLRQQSLYGANTNIGPIVALCEMAFPLGASDDTNSPSASLHRVKQVLAIHLSAAWNLAYQNPGPILVPLPRQTPALRDAVGAYIDNDVRR